MQKQQGSIVLWIIAVVVVGTVLGGSLYATQQSKTETDSEQQATTTQETSATTTEAVEEDAVVETTMGEPAPQKTPTPPPPPVVIPNSPLPPQQEVTPPEEVVKEPVVEKVHVFADDDGADPSIINVTKGNTVELTFEVSTSNVRFGGLLFKSEDLTSGDVLPGESKTITFTAETSQTFGVFWPSSNHRKPFNVTLNVLDN